MDHWLIDSINVTGGFLDGLTLEFPRSPSLICVIGPRGSGKSTLIEAIRHGMGERVDPSNKDRAGLIETNLGPAKITIRTMPSKHTEALVIYRRSRDAAIVTRTDGSALPGIDLERGTLLRLDAYGDKEIENIAKEQLGPKRRQLIDELHDHQYDELLLNLSNLRRQLDANADAIRNERRKEEDLANQLVELPGARDQLKALPDPTLSTGDAQPFAKAEQQSRYNKEESRKVQVTLQQHTDTLNALERIASMANSFQLDVVPTSENRATLLEANAIAQSTADAIKLHLQQLNHTIRDGLQRLEGVVQTLNDSHARQEADFQALRVKNDELGEQFKRRGQLADKVRHLEEVSEKLQGVRTEINRLLDDRRQIKGTYLLERERCSTLREQITTRLQEGLEKRVRLRVQRNADNSKYDAMLTEGLHGARVRNHNDIKARLLEVRPEALAEMIRLNEVAELDTQTSLGEDRCRKILDSFGTTVDPFKLEVVEFEDRIAIELNVGTEGEPHFKDAKDLSSGQKCTALLPLLLARRHVPLIIDQPEDNLDNHFIYETVVEAVTRLKSQRQMIFVTHNANIPVLGKADLVVVMDSDGHRGFISKHGTVDECRGEIIDLLEGGEKAFDLRRQHYGI